MNQALIIHLDSPMQSWGINSRYRLRQAGEAPSKSALCGMVCAAMGASRQSPEETCIINSFNRLRMASVSLSSHRDGHAELLRDYHTVLATRNAEGKTLKHAVLTERYYHQDKKFVVILESHDSVFLQKIRKALISPIWGIWFGRKCCIPSAPLIREELLEPAEARDILHSSYPTDDWDWEIFEEVSDFEAGTDTWLDQPVGFGRCDSSGREGRAWQLRRIRHSIPQRSEARRINHIEVLNETGYFQGF